MMRPGPLSPSLSAELQQGFVSYKMGANKLNPNAPPPGFNPGDIAAKRLAEMSAGPASGPQNNAHAPGAKGSPFTKQPYNPAARPLSFNEG